jgi:hypothetical protein
MTLTDLTTNMARYLDRLKTRFPHIEEDALQAAEDLGGVVAHVAARHDLTPLEAHEEIADWLFVESLARQACELRAG